MTTAKPFRVLMTGASSGIGLEAARQLNAEGHHLSLVCRNTDRAKQVSMQIDNNANLLVVDLADLQAVVDLADTLLHSKQYFDVLVLNAGLQYAGHQQARMNAQGVELTYAVNHLAHHVLASKLIRNTRRVVITASEVHNPATAGGKVGPPAGLGTMAGLNAGHDGAAMVDGITPFNADKAYKDSKLCNMLMGLELSQQHPDRPVICWSPGLVIPRTNTGFFRESRKANPIGQIIFAFVARDLFRITESPEQAGEYLNHLILDPSIPNGFSYWSNTLIGPGRHRFERTSSSDEAADPTKAKALWQLSETQIRAGLAATND